VANLHRFTGATISITVSVGNRLFRMILVSTNDNAFDAIDLTRAQARVVTAGRVLGADPVSIIV